MSCDHQPDVALFYIKSVTVLSSIQKINDRLLSSRSADILDVILLMFVYFTC